jgi:hypothetical protein
VSSRNAEVPGATQDAEVAPFSISSARAGKKYQDTQNANKLYRMLRAS